MKFENNIVKKYGLTFDITIWEEDKIVWLNHLVVPQKLRNKGIGSKVMQEFCNWLDDNHYNCKILILKMTLFNFYSPFNFIKETKDILYRKGL